MVVHTMQKGNRSYSGFIVAAIYYYQYKQKITFKLQGENIIARMVPDRLSYSEMAIQSAFCYPSEMTESWDKYLEHKDSIMQRIRNYMGNYVLYLPQINKQVKKLEEQFFSGQALYNTIKRTIS